jgi:8-oxo-dGTP pyrophosphatase MutT (NUDIX family)
MSDTVSVRPASTVALLRDGEHGLETLLLRRNRALAFAGGFWVFPGGVVDDSDREQAGSDDDAAARIAAARESQEEAGISPDPDGMVLVSHWTTPLAEKKRFSTWIYTAVVSADAVVTIDGSEIHDFQWIGVHAALRTHREVLPLMPPTYITLKALSRYASADAAVSGERLTPCPRVIPAMIPRTEEEGGFLTVYPGDVAYTGGNVDAPGPRHRTVLKDGCWHYEYCDVGDCEPLYPLD